VTAHNVAGRRRGGTRHEMLLRVREGRHELLVICILQSRLIAALSRKEKKRETEGGTLGTELNLLGVFAMLP
jgi:hypothetical protein